jgi:DNA-binding NarL/FixJ family response regulator
MPPEVAAMRLLLVEKDPAWRRNLKQALEAFGGEVVVIEATATEALALLPEAGVDLLLVGLGTLSAQEVAAAEGLRRRSHGVPLVLVCPVKNDTSLFVALTLGASACASRDTPPEYLVSTLLRVKEGESPIQYDLLSRSGVVEQVLRWFREQPTVPPSPPTLSPLSPRERRILQYVAHGYSNKEIGQRVGVTEQTVKNQVSTILRKVQARDRAHAAVMALTNGWVTLAPGEAPPPPLPGTWPDGPQERDRRGRLPLRPS